MSKSERLKAYKKGHRAEVWTAFYYALFGYRVISRRFKTAQGEVDLIMRKGKSLVFIEVKARAKIAGAFEAVDMHSRRRIERAAQMFLAENPKYSGFSMRFDVIGVLLMWNFVPIRFVRIDNAWMLGA